MPASKNGRNTGIFAETFHVASIVYFVTHIPITAFLDSQIVLPRELYPSWAAYLMQDFLVSHFGDPLVAAKPVWFKAVVAAECCCQLPFFFLALYAYAYRRNWIRIPMIIYGSHVATTMVPILGELVAFAARHDDDLLMPPQARRWGLVAIYMPYLVMPVLLTIYMAANSKPFGPSLHHQMGKQVGKAA